MGGGGRARVISQRPRRRTCFKIPLKGSSSARPMRLPKRCFLRRGHSGLLITTRAFRQRCPRRHHAGRSFRRARPGLAVARETLSAAQGDVSAAYRLGLAYRTEGRSSRPGRRGPLAARRRERGQRRRRSPRAMFESGTVSLGTLPRLHVYDRAASSSAAPFIRDFAVKERDRLAATTGAAIPHLGK